MISYQPSFFDDSDRLTALRRLGDPLMELSKHIDFEMFRPKLEEALRKEDRKSPAGRKSLDVIVMLKLFSYKGFIISATSSSNFKLLIATLSPIFLVFTEYQKAQILRLFGNSAMRWRQKVSSENYSTFSMLN